MFSLLTKIWRLVLDILFPNICFSCRRFLKDDEKVLCAACSRELIIASALSCPVCSARLPVSPIPPRLNYCHPAAGFRLGAALSYRTPAVRSLIHALKFGRLTPAGELLGKCLASYAEGLGLLFQNYVIVPIPLSASRRRARGFNQAELLASILARRLNLPLKYLLIRTRHTHPQAELKRAAREHNIAGCFAIRFPEAVKKQNIILVDDVYTSGSTIREAVQTLKTAGSGTITVLVAARA